MRGGRGPITVSEEVKPLLRGEWQLWTVGKKNTILGEFWKPPLGNRMEKEMENALYVIDWDYETTSWTMGVIRCFTKIEMALYPSPQRYP